MPLTINPTFDTRPIIRVKTSEFPSFRGMSPVRRGSGTVLYGLTYGLPRRLCFFTYIVMKLHSRQLCSWILPALLLAMAGRGALGQASGGGSVGPVLQLTNPYCILACDSALRFLRDPSRDLTVSQVLARPAGDWSALKPGRLTSFGFTSDVYWLRLRVRCAGAAAGEVLVLLENSRLEKVDWFLVRNGEVRERERSGNQRSRAESKLQTRIPAFDVDLRAGEEAEILLRVDSRTSMYFPLRVYGSLVAHTNEALRREGPGLMFVGFAASLFCLNLILGVILRSRLHLINALLVGLLTVYFLLYGGYWSWLGLPFGPELTLHPFLCILLGTLLTVGLFTREFIPRNLRSGFAGRMLAGSLAAVLTGLVIIPFVSFRAAFGIVAVMSMVMLWGSAAVAVWLYRADKKGGTGLVLAAWVIDAAITSNLVLQWLGVIPFWLPVAAGQMAFFGVTAVLFLAASTQRVYGLMQEQVQSSRLERALAESRLRALRYQVNPHFLFNAINSAISLVQTEPSRAAPFLYRLAEFLRATSRDESNSTVPLSEELEKLTAYLEVERVRFEERLEVSLAIPAELEGCRVPELILQPLVENAIKHGGRQTLQRLRLRISARREGHLLWLEVANTGHLAAAGPPPPDSGGIGLKNLRERLQIVYGARASLTLTEEKGWVLARLSLPANADPPTGAFGQTAGREPQVLE